MENHLETCTKCQEFSNLEIMEITQAEGEPKAYKCQCTNCLHIDIYQEDLDTFYQGMNDMRED